MLLLLFSGAATGGGGGPTTGITAPTGLTVYRYGSKYVELSWTPSVRSDAAGVSHYKLYIDDVWDGQNIPAVWNSSTMNADKLTLTPGLTYEFYVTAVDSFGVETDPTNTVTITTPRNQDVGKFKKRRYYY
jgi:penicillin-binding protein 2A